MKTLSPSHLSSSRQGVALVIVLSVLVLMSALLVAFMGTVSTERLSQRAAYSTFEAQQAAESAVNLVISQIRAATTETDNGDQAWASQPGVIRTFGKASKVYKLYSSDRMQVSEGDYRPESPAESGIDPSNPQVAPDSGFVDINQPILVPTQKGKVDPHYPIVDPRAALNRDGNATDGMNGRVEGFWVPQNLKHPSKVEDSAGVDVMELPMRVRWLYHLRDGTVVAPDPISKRLPLATKENPPVARVAFWTDDESSKLNINTAGEHTYWDTPQASNYQESGHAPNPNSSPSNVDYSRGESAALAAAQPSAGEYQRYPGHPATTNLSPALRWLFPKPGDSTIMSPQLDPVEKNSEADFKQTIYRLSPRLRDAFGSSMGGYRANFDINIDYRIPKRDRLFASLDEFWFRPDRSPISGPSYFGTLTDMSQSPKLDTNFVDKKFGSPQALEQLRFFLTASSRASDLNLFGLPRVCIWPIHEIDDSNPNNSKRTGFDDLIAFCQTVAAKPYYFTRKEPWHPNNDYLLSGTTATEVLRSFPRRNKALVLGENKDGYLRRMAAKVIPGPGGSFENKYKASAPGSTYTEIDRILISIFDYIRSTNLIDTGRKTDTAPPAGYPLAYTPGYSPLNPAKYEINDPAVLGSGQVIPTVLPPTGKPEIKGFGRFVNLAEVGLLFYRDTAVLPGDPPLPAAQGSDERISFRCVLLPEMMTVSPYYPGINPGYAYTVKETTPFKISNPADPNFPEQELRLADGSYNFVDINSYRVQYGRFWMPGQGFINQFWTEASGSRVAKSFNKPNSSAAGGTVGYSKFPFYSKRIDLGFKKPTDPEKEFKLSEGTLEFEFFPLNVTVAQTPNPPRALPAAPNSLQVVNVKFPQLTHVVPKPSTAFQSRTQAQPSDSGRSWIDGFADLDVIRTVEPNGKARGDHRHIAGLAVVPEDYWAPSGLARTDYDSKTVMRVHNFHNSWGGDFNGAKKANITTNGSHRSGKSSKVPGYNGQAVFADGTVGDFDRGISKHHDGAFINKPDEGNTRFDLGDDPGGGGYLPYFRGDRGYEEVGSKWFSPNRLIPSAVMFGSLPSGLFPDVVGGSPRAWETLLFSPPISASHKGAAVSPADHYMLDWFTMPVVEPFAISEPLSTMGKINLNSRIAPFGYVKMTDSKGAKRSYIQRHTGLFGIFKNMRQFVLVANAPSASHNESPLSDSSTKSRWEVDPQAMVDNIIDPALDDRKYFKTASEVCELDLPLKNTFKDKPSANPGKFNPKYKSAATDRRTFWTANSMSGDNSREKPYAHIYPRLTTKSNVYTVHVWAQSLAKNHTSKDWDLFDEETDRILGEYRGSTTIERYIDVKEEVLEQYDAVVDSNAKSLDAYYRFRIVNNKRFIVQ